MDFIGRYMGGAQSLSLSTSSTTFQVPKGSRTARIAAIGGPIFIALGGLDPTTSGAYLPADHVAHVDVRGSGADTIALASVSGAASANIIIQSC